jgi:hypothetical protein
MHQEALEELAESIKAQGVMQPIVVRLIGPEKYEIIAGERRWRATQLAGLDRIPAVVRDVPDEAAIAMAVLVPVYLLVASWAHGQPDSGAIGAAITLVGLWNAAKFAVSCLVITVLMLLHPKQRPPR